MFENQASVTPTLRWYTYADNPWSSEFVNVNGEHLRELEQALSRLIHHHQPHLERILPSADDWLLRAVNCLELLKDFLRKTPSENQQPAVAEALRKPVLRFECEDVIQKMALPLRWKRKVIELCSQWPALQSLAWHLAFLALTSKEPVSIVILAWVEEHAPSLSDVMARDNGLELCVLLSRVGPHCDWRWLHTTLSFLNDPQLAQTIFADRFSTADHLAQTFRDLLRHAAPSSFVDAARPTLADKFTDQLKTLVSLKPGEISKITCLLGSLVSNQLSELVRAVNGRARSEEKRLSKELHQLRELGVKGYEDLIGKHCAHSRAHVATNLREEGRSLLTLFEIVDWLTSNPGDARQLDAITEFFEYASQFRISTRIHLAAEWQKLGWLRVNKFFPAINKLFERRGVHAQLKRHWLRRSWPSITSQDVHVDLIATGLRYAEAQGWRLAVKLLESLVYDGDERLTEECVTALVTLAEAVPSLEVARELWRKLPVDLLAKATSFEIREAIWVTQDTQELRMLLAWFHMHSMVSEHSAQIRRATREPIQLELLRRLMMERDLATIESWHESLEILASCGVSLSEPISTVSSFDWIGKYPEAFHDVLNSLARVTKLAERIAEQVLGGLCPSAAQISAEIAQLKELLTDSQRMTDGSMVRAERITKRIENLNRQLLVPPTLKPATEAKLIGKLQARLGKAALAEVHTLAQETLRIKLGAIDSEGLYQKLNRPPYDRILPALTKLKSVEQRLAWRALGTSWDNSLKLLAEPANEKFLKLMTSKGINMDDWLSPEFALMGKRADGTDYRIAFTQDPLDILLMGHHFQTCLALNGVNFFSTVSNLVDANKRVIYGRTTKGQIVGRCLFALTGEGKLQTFSRYQHDPRDGFADLVDQFAERLVTSMKTEQTEYGHVPCLVSKAWYDDGCLPVPSSDQNRAAAYFKAISEDDESRSRDPWELAMEVFGSKATLIGNLAELHARGLYFDTLTVKSWFPHLVGEAQVSLAHGLRMAACVWYAGNRELARRVFAGWTDREIFRSLGPSTMGQLIEQFGFAELIVDRDPYLARRFLRRSRTKNVRNDDQETTERRCELRDLIAQAM